MANYLLTYIGGDQPANPEEGKAHYQKYQAWLGSLGNAVISPANPVKNTHVIKPNGSVLAEGVTSMSGYTIISASSMDEALALAKGCPFLEINGSLEVSELIQM